MLERFKNEKPLKKILLILPIVYFLALMAYLAKDVLDSPSKSLLGLAIGATLYFIHNRRKKRVTNKTSADSSSKGSELTEELK